MNMQEAMKYQEAIIASAMDWVEGNSSISGQEELVVIADHYKINLPVCFKHFVHAESPSKFTATGAYITISKVLQRLAHKIRQESKADNTQ